MRPDLASLKQQFKEDTIKAASEQAKSRISQEDLARLSPNINHFVYLTGYSAKELGERVDVVIEALPDEFFKQTFRKTKAKTATLIAEELLSSHYNLSNDNEFLDFLYELVDKIAGLFKESAIESLTGETIKPPVKIDKGDMRSENYASGLYERLIEAEDPRVIASEAITYLKYLVKNGDLLHLDDLKRGDPGERLECLNKYFIATSGIAIALKSHPGNKDLLSASELVKSMNITRLNDIDKTKLAIYAVDGKKGDVEQPNGLTKRQELALKLLSKAKERTEEQIEFLQGVIKDSIGDMRLNGVLSKLLSETAVPSGITNSAVEFMKDFTYKTKDSEVFLAASEKLGRNYERFKKGEDPDPNDKVTLREYGILMKYANLENKFTKLYAMKIIEGNEDLENIYYAVKACAPIIRELNEKIGEEIEYESGDIMMNNIQKEIELKNELSLHNKLAMLVATEHLHTMKLFVGETPKQVSHVFEGSVRIDRLKMVEYLFSDLYKIKIEKLVVGKFESELQAKYGPDYAVEINKIYRGIELDIHKAADKKFRNITLESLLTVVKAGLADFLPFLGHTKVNPDNLNTLHGKMMADVVEENEMICSEFAARTTAAAFVELNKRLQSALGTTENVIDIPFDARERFSKINPDRLLQILEAKGCIEEAPRTKTETQFITFADKVKASSPAQLGR